MLNLNFDFLKNFLNSNFTENLALNGLISPFDLFLVEKILKNKKILYLTSSEQEALKTQKDLKSLLNVDSYLFPNQEIH